MIMWNSPTRGAGGGGGQRGGPNNKDKPEENHNTPLNIQRILVLCTLCTIGYYVFTLSICSICTRKIRGQFL